MENEIVNADTSNGEEIITQDVATTPPGDEVTKLQKEKAELETKNRQLFERAKKAEGFVLKDGHWVKPPKEAPIVQQSAPQTGEVEDTTQLLLEVKGLTKDSEVELFQRWKTDTNRKPREILNNKIFQAELAELRSQEATQAAIPAGNGRGGGGNAQSVEAALAKFEKTKELPEDFALKAKVLDRVAAKDGLRTPPWRR